MMYFQWLAIEDKIKLVRKFLVPIILLDLLAFGAALAILFKVPPQIDGQLVISNVVYFFIACYLLVALSFALVLYFAQAILGFPFKKHEDFKETPRRTVRKALRDGFLLSSVLLILALLQLTKTNNYFNTALVVLIGVLIEVYLKTR